EAITGKPSEHMVQAVMERLGLAPAQIAMVGDRLSTDVTMAAQTGMAGVLVLSGATRRGDLELSDVKPRYVVDDLTQLLPSPPRPARSARPADLPALPDAPSHEDRG